MKLFKLLKASCLIGCSAIALQAAADTGFKVPMSYNIELVDGLDEPEEYSRMNRLITLSPGRHQIVVRFGDNFDRDKGIVQSANPLVIDIYALQQDQVITFDYPAITSDDAAHRFAREQKVTLCDVNGKPIPANVAEYFLLTSENGFTVLRDYRQELMSLGRLYAPAYVAGANRGMGMTEYGTPTIKAENTGNLLTAGAPSNITMDAPNTSYEQESGMSTTTKGKKKGSVSLNQLVNLYNKADDQTKLKFVQYVMSH
ncbi:MAG: DUF2057 domain-containing protein [Succinivibrio sp.]|nr:DUF2057 domain-containing protein [Succinivibrio sp.]